MEKNIKLEGEALYHYLINRFQMTGYQAITTMIDRKQDLRWFEKLPTEDQMNILKDI